MKTMCPPGYHQNGFVATHALGRMMYIMTNFFFTLRCVTLMIYQIKLFVKYQIEHWTG